ncbi:MAG: alkyl hydroperoxide reductase [SAR202 cluster bacterium]|nr:alkyl hydroperoxide reductase [SAR202 cluster bacterium]
MHIFPQLRKLERKYEGSLAVVGVHSAKFIQERETDSLRRAVLRYGIEHPVVNDRDFEIWGQYAIRAWPTLMFIDPRGKVIGKHEGEFPLEPVDELIGRLVAEFGQKGLLDLRPLPVKLERDKEKDGALSFPGKVLADQKSGRLFIADSNHQKIVVATVDGHVLNVVGSGAQGLADGGFAAAQFNDPQGMALDGERLYVADTKNHAIREINLREKNVTTLAGTGEQATMFHSGGPGRTTAMRSPWDITLHLGALYIAMAGFHQLWRLDLATNETRPYAGSGREHIVDGPLAMAALAQPSGITTDGKKLYFTDSETSSVRSADLDPSGAVESIVGLDLFTFGDMDGVGDDVRLQHPIGICLMDSGLAVADTYNNKIKFISPAERRASSLFGNNLPGHQDGEGRAAQFNEPGGVSAARGKLYIADTNNHSVRVADLESKLVTTLELRF